MPPETFSFVHILTDVIPTAGVGGTLALVMFYFYRQDSERNAKRFEEIIGRQEKTSEDWVRIVQENTKALTIINERSR